MSCIYLQYLNPLFLLGKTFTSHGGMGDIGLAQWIFSPLTAKATSFYHWLTRCVFESTPLGLMLRAVDKLINLGCF